MSKINKYFLALLTGTVILISCHKKEKQAIAGTYTGEERYVYIGPYYDTLYDSTYSQSITLTLVENKTFVVSKSTYPFSYEISANHLLEYDSVRKWDILPEEIWTILVVSDSLYGRFEENNSWAGSQDHYTFVGKK